MVNAAFKPSALRIRGIDHLLLKVLDMERAIAFYQGVLGCNLEKRLPQYAMAELAAGDQRLDLVDISTDEGAWARPSDVDGGNLHHFCLAAEVAHEAGLRAHLSTNAVEIVEKRREDGFTSFYVLDPSGNQVELRFQAAGEMRPSNCA